MESSSFQKNVVALLLCSLLLTAARLEMAAPQAITTNTSLFLSLLFFFSWKEILDFPNIPSHRPKG